MSEPLLSYGPVDMGDDEQTIAKGYRQGWKMAAYEGLPLLVLTYFVDVKWVVAFGIVAVLAAINAIEGRLYDLCIRIRRTNVLLSEGKRSGIDSF